MSARRESRLRAFAARLRGFVRGYRPDPDFDAEVQEHLRLLTERFVAEGLSPDEAAAAARRQFGNTLRLREDRRELQTFPAIESLVEDVGYAVRTLARSRGFAAAAIATLGLGIGAATAIFSVIYGVLLEPFPYAGARRMLFPRIHDTRKSEGEGRQGYRPAEVLEVFEKNHVFEAITAANGEMLTYRHGEGAEQLSAARVTPGTSEFFGMPALYGRVLQPADYEPGAPPVFIMRHKTWIERFDGDLSVLNQTLVLNGTPRTLVGIMPPRFGWYGADVLIPQKLTSATNAGLAEPSWFVLGRLKPGVSAREAAADLTVIARGLAARFPQEYPQHFTVQTRKLGDSVVGRIEPTLYTVLAAVGLLLLIACSNVANLMLARATARQKEFALRTVLGAGRARIVRLLMVESLVIALAGALLGIFLAWGGLKSLVAAMPADVIPSESVIELNTPVLAFALGVAVLTAVLFGLAPALQSTRRDLSDPLRDSAKGSSGRGRSRRLRDAVVVLEVALALTLLVGAGLLMRSFVALREVRLGIRADHVFQAVLPLPSDRYKTAEQAMAVLRPLLARLRVVPGVVDAAGASTVPPRGGLETAVEIAGKTREEEWRTLFQHVSEGYFRVLRIDVERGRTFTEAEVDDGRAVAVVNETFVRKYLPGEDPIGQRLRLATLSSSAAPPRSDWLEIVGVTGDVTNRGLHLPPAPQVWVPSSLEAGVEGYALIVRTSQDPGSIANAVRKAVWDTDSGLALAFLGPLEDRISEGLYAGPRFGFLLMTIFGGIGLVLVAIGVYSVLAYATLQRTHEIGIRIALGAEDADVLGMVVGTGLRLVVAGLAIGIAASLALGRAMGPQLTGVTGYDPRTLATAACVLTLTAAIASFIPARRAARVDPMVALRYE
jgi:putative ABC transport system permease protein